MLPYFLEKGAPSEMCPQGAFALAFHYFSLRAVLERVTSTMPTVTFIVAISILPARTHGNPLIKKSRPAIAKNMFIVFTSSSVSCDSDNISNIAYISLKVKPKTKAAKSGSNL